MWQQIDKQCVLSAYNLNVQSNTLLKWACTCTLCIIETVRWQVSSANTGDHYTMCLTVRGYNNSPCVFVAEWTTRVKWASLIKQQQTSDCMWAQTFFYKCPCYSAIDHSRSQTTPVYGHYYPVNRRTTLTANSSSLPLTTTRLLASNKTTCQYLNTLAEILEVGTKF